MTGPTPVEPALAAMLTPGVLPPTLLAVVLCDFAAHAVRTIEDATDVSFPDLHAPIALYRDAFWRNAPRPSLLDQPPAVQSILLWFGDFTRSRMHQTGPAHVYRAIALGAATRAAEVVGRQRGGQIHPTKYARTLRGERAWQHQHLLRVLRAAHAGSPHPLWTDPLPDSCPEPDGDPSRG